MVSFGGLVWGLATVGLLEDNLWVGLAWIAGWAYLWWRCR